MRPDPRGSMRHPLLALLPLVALGACGGDTKKAASDTSTQGETFVPGDTTPNEDAPGDSASGNHPPELERIGDRSVAIGQTLSITLEAKDPDGDKLTYSVFGNLPDG